MATYVPELETYVKRLNWYLQQHYPANKKISAEEWNALFVALINQGNAQEETLAQICNAILPVHVSTINELIDITIDLNTKVGNLTDTALCLDNFFAGEYVTLLKIDGNITISFNAGAAIYDKIIIGNTQTGAPGSQATVTKEAVGDQTQLNFTIPQGPQGIQGVPGYGWVAMEVENGDLLVKTVEMNPSSFSIGPDGYMRIEI